MNGAWGTAWLLNHVWQSTLFVGAVWLATLALHGHAARVRCWLWTAASAKFLVPVSLLVSLGQLWHVQAAPSVLPPAVLVVMEDVLAPAGTVETIAAGSIPSPAPAWPWLLAALWGAGAAAVLVSWWRQWRPIGTALRHATPMRLEALYDAADLEVLSSPAMAEPGVVGIWRQRLLLPEGIDRRLNPAQLRAVIAHERCHMRCHDNLAAWLHMMVEALFWFHPAVWWIERRIVHERERACDEAVLRAGSHPQDYAEGILEICRRSVGVRLGVVSGVSGSHLRTRVEAIMRNEIGRPMTRVQVWTLAVTVVAAVSAPVAKGALLAASQDVAPSGLAFDAASVAPGRAFPVGRGPNPALEASIVRRHTRIEEDGRFTTSGPLQALVQAAYDVADGQIEGGPAWVRADRFTIEARPPRNATPDQIRGMLQSLLAETFKLTLRREARTLPVYELVPAEGGVTVTAMTAGSCTPARQVRWDLIDLEAPLYVCDSFRRRVLSQSPETRPRPRWPRVTRIEAGGASMSSLIEFISVDLDRVVLDRTGFTSRFNVVLDFAPPSDPLASGPALFDAIRDQLGLRLVATSAPVDVLVIDRVERPSSN